MLFFSAAEIPKADSGSKEDGTYRFQSKLPKLPIPSLEDTIRNYLDAVRPLQTPAAHEHTKKVSQQFLAKEGPRLQTKLKEYASDKASYIEEFWYDSYLSWGESVVLNVNPFFVLEDDPTPARSNQLNRAASLVLSSLKFVQEVRKETLEPDSFRGQPLCMDQYRRLFGAARIPTGNGCRMKTSEESTHIVVLCRSQFYWFDVINASNDICISESQLISNLAAIKKDAHSEAPELLAKNAVGVLTSEKRPVWAEFRELLAQSTTKNAEILDLVDSALFVLCLDDVSPTSGAELANNMLCGTYDISTDSQTGTCTNRWYDKLQIIVCKNGSAGVNFEHTGVDGHTVLRFVSDVFTDTIIKFAQSINIKAKSLMPGTCAKEMDAAHVLPKKLEWEITSELQRGIKYAESRLSDLLLQNEVDVLEFKGYGKCFITSMRMSPDAFVQMAFQAAYYDMYGHSVTTYEPAMTKAYLHGRTEAIRTVTDESVAFTKAYTSPNASTFEVLKKLRTALKRHSMMTKNCSNGLGQDRHLFALQCIHQRHFAVEEQPQPAFFADEGWKVLNETILSTSNCGNPALRLFGFGPVTAGGFGIGYIIKDNSIHLCTASKHRQTGRFLKQIEKYFMTIQEVLLREQSEQFPHMRKASEQRAGYGFFDAGEALTPLQVGSRPVGRALSMPLE